MFWYFFFFSTEQTWGLIVQPKNSVRTVIIFSYSTKSTVYAISLKSRETVYLTKILSV